MHKTNKRIKNFIRNRKFRKSYLLTAVFLSVIVAFTVTASLVLPAITASQDDIMPMSESENGVITLESEDITSVDFSVTGGSIDSKQVKFTLNYIVGAGQLNSNCKTITYQLPDGVSIPNAITGDSNKIIDGADVAGYFTISETGLITITCTDEYIAKKQSELDSTGAKGTLTFDATVNRGADNNGDVVIDFGTDEGAPSVTIPFDAKTLNVSKTGTPGNNGKITWQITVENPQLHDLGGYVLSDEMFKGMTGVTTSPENVGAFDSENGTITFNQGVTDKNITITYTSDVTQDSIFDANTNNYGSISNTVQLTPDDTNDENDTPVDNTANVYVANSFNIQKSGKNNYSDTSNPSVDWTITLTNSMGVNLNGMIIRDEMFKYIEAGDISLPDGVTFTVDKTNGYLTITSDTNLTSLDIKYNSTVKSDGTDINLGDTVTNSAQIMDDKNTPDDKTDDTVFGNTNDTYITYNPYYFDKYSSVDSPNQLITWSIKFSKNDDAAEGLTGFKITDSMFSDAIDGSIKVTEENWPNDAIPYTIDGDVITIGDTSEKAVIVTFQTSATDFADGEGKTVNTATVTDKDSEDVLYTDTDTATYVAKNEISKGLQGNVKDPQNEDKLTISYSIRVLQELGVKSQTITDILSADDNNAEIYFTKAQAESFNVTYATKNDVWGNTTLDPMYYTLKFYDKNGQLIDFNTNPEAKATKFEIVLNQSIEPDEFYAINIYYSATADASNITAGSTVNFKNNATSDTVSGTPSQTVSHTKIDYSDTPYEKYNAKNDGTTDRTKLSVEELEKVTIDGVEHYVLDWYVELNENGNYAGVYPIVFRDTLPEGFELYDGVKIYNSDWANKNSAYSWTISTDSYANEYYAVTTNGDTQTVDITFKGSFYGVRTIYYKAVIPVTELNNKIKNSNGSYVFGNTFEDTSGKYAPVTHTQEIKQGVLDKNNLNSENPYKRYEIVVNPGGANLSTGDEIVLTDTFITTDYNDNGTIYYCTDKGAVNVNLNEIKVYEVDENGNKTLLDKSQYSYVFDNQPELKTTQHNIQLTHRDANSKYWDVSDITIPAGAEITIHYEGLDDNYLTANNGTSFKFKDTWSDTDVSYGYYTSDGNGNATFTFTTTKAYSGNFFVELWSDGNVPDNVYMTYETTSHDYAAQLELTLPDEKSLVVEYTYYCTKKENTPDKVGVMNSVKTDTQLGAEISENGDVLVLTGNSSGTLETDEYLTVEKVDIGSYADNLVAEFELYKYDSENKVWLPAINFVTTDGKKAKTVTWGGSQDDTPATFITASTGNPQFSFYLTKGVLYKLIEKTAPDGYVRIEDDIYFAYSEMPSSNELPDGVTSSDIELTLPRGSMYVKNHTLTDLIVNKEWLDDNVDHSQDSVTVQLYSSTSKVTNGFPTKLTEVGAPVVLNQSNSWQYKWTDLPTGNNDGQALYYYVKEISYNVNGVETQVSENSSYVPYYIGNAVNKYNGTPIKIVNTNGLAVEKLWVDADNKTMDAPVSEIRFQIYKSIVSPTDPNRQNGVNGLPIDATLVEINSVNEFTLSQSNNWKVLIKGLSDFDGEDNRYYYYVVETSQTDGFTVSYNDNGNSNNGVIQIKNKSDSKIDVNTGTTLPETGGRGTTIYYVIGLMIIVCAIIAYLFINKKKFIKE